MTPNFKTTSKMKKLKKMKRHLKRKMPSKMKTTSKLKTTSTNRSNLIIEEDFTVSATSFQGLYFCPSITFPLVVP